LERLLDGMDVLLSFTKINRSIMTNNKQQTEQEKLNRIKMITELKQNKTFLSILADFRLYKVHSMTIFNNQIEDEFELASYWLNVQLNEQLNKPTEEVSNETIHRRTSIGNNCQYKQRCKREFSRVIERYRS
jgi:hypothetical protein